MSEPPPSYAELAALVAEQAAQLAEQAAQLAEQAMLIEALRVELEALRRQVGRDSSNSSQPPSTDGPAAKAKAKAKAEAEAARQQAEQQGQLSPEEQSAATEPSGRGRPRRKQGGQPGHRGSGLVPVATPDRREPVEPACCGGCGGGLADAPGTVGTRVQVFDLPGFSLSVTEYQMMRRVCDCGHATTADLPAGVRGGLTCYGPNVTAAATLLASQDVLSIERTADLMSTLLGAPVSTGFISCCLTRLDDALTTAGFEPALKTALIAQEVLGTDETPAPLTDAATREPDCHNPHVYTVRTMRAHTGGGADLVWYGAAGDRTMASISAFGILDDFRGVLVRDDFGGYVHYDDELAGVQQCLAHVLRYLDDAHAINIDVQAWARQVADALREAIHEINTARAAGRTDLDTERSPGYGTATTTAWRSGSPPTCPDPGPRATTPACNWPDASNEKPTRCGCSPPDPTCPPRTTARNQRSAGSNSPPRSKAAGAPCPPCNGTAGSGPTSSAPATTDADPWTPSATP